MYLLAEFAEREAIIRVLRDLKESGVKPEDVDVFSDVPLELPRSALKRTSHMSLAVVTGAVLIGLTVIGFVYLAQHNYPLVTGGMPIFSFWATGVVFYELTMLGAILTSLTWFLIEAGVFKRRRKPAPLFDAGLICLRVGCDAGHEALIRRLMEAAGGSSYRTEQG